MEGYDRSRVTVVKFRVNYGGGNGAGCFEVKVRADTAKFTNVIVARLYQVSSTTLRGHTLKINKPEVNLDVRNFFSQLGL